MKKRSYLLTLTLLILIFSQPVFKSQVSLAKDASSALKTLTDPSTIDNYREEFSLSQASLETSGKIWGDKSVFSPTQAPLIIDDHAIPFDGDFMEVFSLLGSTASITKQSMNLSRDYVFVLDLSSSMSMTTSSGETRIEKAINAVNRAVSTILSQNEKNRVGLVCFGTKAVELAPLAHYLELSIGLKKVEPDTTTGTCIYLELLSRPEGITDKKGIDNSAENTQSKTNLRDALGAGLDLLIRSSETENEPVMILVSNGAPTMLNTYSPFSDGIRTIPFVSAEPNNRLMKEASALSTLMTAAFKKALVKAQYKKEPRIYTIGVDIDEKEVDELSLLLDPKDYFNTHSDSRLLELWNTWCGSDRNMELSFTDAQSYLKPDVSVPKRPTSAELVISAFPSDRGILKSEMIEYFYFADGFYNISSDRLSEMFEEIVGKTFVPTFSLIDPETENALGDKGSLTYIDPIGEGLKIKSLERLILSGCSYQLKPLATVMEEDQTITSYKILTHGPQEQKFLPDTEALEKLQIQTITESTGREYLRVAVPDSLIPVIRTDVTVTEAPDEAFDPCIEFISDLDSVHPLRLVYALSYDTDLKEDPPYDVYYTNRFSGTEYSDHHTRGEAYYTFVPSPENPYYFSAEEEPVYQFRQKETSSLMILEPLLVTEPVVVEETYYLKTKNFTSHSGESDRLIPVSGETVTKHQKKDRTQRDLAVYVETGVNLHEDQLDLRRSKTENQTQTASLLTASELEEEHKIVRTFLGNNGKVLLEEKEAKLSLQKFQRTEKVDLTQDEIEVMDNETVTYELVLKNHGNEIAREITVVDEVDEELVILENTVSGNGIVKDQRISWQLPLLKPEEEVTLCFQVITPCKDTTTSWENSAFFYQEKRQINPEYSNKVVLITRPSIMTIEKLQSVNGSIITKAPIQAKIGDTLTYYLTIHNTGIRAAYNITVTDTIPPGLTPLKESITTNGSISNNAIEWNVPILELNEDLTLSFSARVTGPELSRCLNQALMTEAFEKRPYRTNEVVAYIRSEKPAPEILITKQQALKGKRSTRNLVSVRPEDIVYYSITVENKSQTVPAKNIIVKDEVDQALAIDPGSISHEGQLSGNSIIWSIPELDSGAALTLRFSVRVPENSITALLKNRAQASLPGSMPLLSNTVYLKYLRPDPLTLTNSVLAPPQTGLKNSNRFWYLASACALLTLILMKIHR